MSDFPHPRGALVRCLHWIDGTPLLATCESHIFVVTHDAEPAKNASGFLQRARCLVCDRNTSLVDGAFFHKLADAFDIAGTIGQLQAIIEGLQSNLDALLGQRTPDLPPAVLKDFG